VPGKCQFESPYFASAAALHHASSSPKILRFPDCSERKSPINVSNVVFAEPEGPSWSHPTWINIEITANNVCLRSSFAPCNDYGPKSNGASGKSLRWVLYGFCPCWYFERLEEFFSHTSGSHGLKNVSRISYCSFRCIGDRLPNNTIMVITSTDVSKRT